MTPASATSKMPGGIQVEVEDKVLTMLDVESESKALAEEARLTFPGQVDRCTYYQGALRQNVWACRDCGDKGVCYACSISCHAEHTLVELWARRDFTCDCPTIPQPSSSGNSICTLNGRHRAVDEPNTGNRYMRNFQNEFCRCQRGLEYDPLQETEAMIACLGCEDWFHESCLNLSELDGGHEQRQEQAGDIEAEMEADFSQTVPQGLDKDQVKEEDEDEDDEKGTRLPSDTYDALICAQCVRSNKLLSSLAGTTGFMMLLPPGSKQDEDGIKLLPDGWCILGFDEGSRDNAKVDENEEDQPSAKRVKLDAQTSTACTRPRPNLQAQEVLADKHGLAKGDIFVSFGARQGICVCKDCKPLVEGLSFPLEDEELYEPPRDMSPDEDLDSTTSRLLETLPRSQALSAIMGFQPIKDRLDTLFKQRSASGLPVTKQDIDGVFEEIKRKRQ